ncbi:MAG TPA: class III cytochrome C [Desulfobacterales bacterium]|nr:class III cytochrome C [Desulfobacterales bacterium]
MKKARKIPLSGLAAVLTLGLMALAGGQAVGFEAPEEVTLDQMADLYEPVEFDHAAHIELTEENCAVCHHHTTGETPVQARCLHCHATPQPAESVACADCHPQNRYAASYLRAMAAAPYRYHTDIVGLKGAYHRLCLACHQEEGAPTGCQECHARTERGDRRFHAGAYAPAQRPQAAHH